MADSKRIEGQIWIGKEQPNVLKYYADGREYWTVTATTHTTSSTVKKGELIAVDPTQTVGGYVRPAVWPEDANSVIGMALNDAVASQEVRVLNYGYVELTETDLDNLFVAQADLKTGATTSAYASTLETLAGGNGMASSTSLGVGHPVYWFTGRTLKSGISSYVWVDSSAYAGKLTFATPCGYKPNKVDKPWNDDSFNITYKQLPIIGTVVKYTAVAGKITDLILHINFSTFSSKIQFEYPATGLKNYATVNTEETIIIRHGLFPNSVTIVPHVDVNMWGYADSDVESGGTGEAFNIHPGFDSFIGSGVDKRTEVEMLSDTTFYYKLMGEVNYNF